MRKMYGLISCLLLVSFYSYSDVGSVDCMQGESVALCLVRSDINTLINEVDLGRFKSQVELLVYSQANCGGYIANKVVEAQQQSIKTHGIVKGICVNEFSVAWMSNIALLNAAKIKNLTQGVAVNHASLVKMNEFIENTKTEIADLKRK